MRKLVLAASIALVLAPSAQDWRAAAVASFNDVWQTINDTFYDPTFGGLDWAGVARELRPRVESARTPEEARAVIREMLARLKRSHFALLSARPGRGLTGPAAVPADVRVTAGGVVITRVTDRSASVAGLAPGQMLLTIDGREVADLVRSAEGVDPREKNLDAWRLVNQALHGREGSSAVLRVRAADKGPREPAAPAGPAGRELRIQRVIAPGEVVTLGNLPPLRVEVDTRELETPRGRRAGFIRFTVWMPAIGESVEHAIDQFRAHDGLVIDLRGNPGGLAGMMSGIAGHLIAEPVVLGTMRTRQAALSFRVNPRTATADGRRVAPFSGPVAIIVDELTGSTSETFAGALQSLGRARVFGRPTMGQALPAITRQLPNGEILIYAVGDFVTSTGKSLEGAGVIPDVTVSLSPTSLAKGRDEPLEAALRWFDTVKRRP